MLEGLCDESGNADESQKILISNVKTYDAVLSLRVAKELNDSCEKIYMDFLNVKGVPNWAQSCEGYKGHMGNRGGGLQGGAECQCW